MKSAVWNGDILAALESAELVRRGNVYIEDTAKKFESRNYTAMLSAVITSVVYIIAIDVSVNTGRLA